MPKGIRLIAHVFRYLCSLDFLHLTCFYLDWSNAHFSQDVRAQWEFRAVVGAPRAQLEGLFNELDWKHRAPQFASEAHISEQWVQTGISFSVGDDELSMAYETMTILELVKIFSEEFITPFLLTLNNYQFWRFGPVETQGKVVSYDMVRRKLDLLYEEMP